MIIHGECWRLEIRFEKVKGALRIESTAPPDGYKHGQFRGTKMYRLSVFINDSQYNTEVTIPY